MYHPTRKKGWKVQKEGASRASGYIDNEADAIERVKELAMVSSGNNYFTIIIIAET